MATKKASKAREAASLWAEAVSTQVVRHRGYTKQERIACADTMYYLYAKTVYGIRDDVPMPGLDEGLAYRCLADQIHRDLGLEARTDRQIANRWEPKEEVPDAR